MADAASVLGQREQALLDFERDWIGRAGGKQTAIRERFGVSAARYYQLLNRVLERPEALDYDPLLVRRLRRRRQQRAQRRLLRPARRREHREEEPRGTSRRS